MFMRRKVCALEARLLCVVEAGLEEIAAAEPQQQLVTKTDYVRVEVVMGPKIVIDVATTAAVAWC